MKNKKLLTIGELSRLTGVNIKSLRYYDSIGVLPPTYVNPENGYRFYSFNQMYIVEAIQFCIDLDIPLRDFSKFVSESADKIHYLKLLNYGKQIAAEKISSINRKLDMLESIQKEMERSKAVAEKKSAEMYMDEIILWVTPFSGIQLSDKFFSVLKEQILEINRLKINTLGDSGLLRIYEEDHHEDYLYVTIEPSIDQNITKLNIISVPAGQYMCRMSRGGDIERANDIFPWITDGKKRTYVFESEMVLESYDFKNPIFELRCSM